MECTLQASLCRLIQRGGWNLTQLPNVLVAFPRDAYGRILTNALRRHITVSSSTSIARGVVITPYLNNTILINFWTIYRDHLEPDLLAIVTPDLTHVLKCTLNCFSDRISLFGSHAEAVIGIKCDAMTNFVWDAVDGQRVALELP
ncbi:hypothetical protein EBT31_08770 [bacterium]|nr:hypothetical protein [bacterium]